MKIYNTKSHEHHAIKALLVAKSGDGKTYRAATTGDKTVVISFESGTLCLDGHDVEIWDCTRDSKDVPLKPAERISALKQCYDKLAAGTDFKWVFIDSLTELAQVMVQTLQAEFPDRKDSLVLWGENAKRMRAIIKNFRDLPKYHVVMTALVDIDKDENNKRHTLPDVPGGLKRELPAFFDEVFFIQRGQNNERFFLTQSTETMPAKDRSGKLDPIEPADLAHVARKILNKKEIKK